MIEVIPEIQRMHWPVHDPHGHINGTVPGSEAVYDCHCGAVYNAPLEAVHGHIDAVYEIRLAPDIEKTAEALWRADEYESDESRQHPFAECRSADYYRG